VCGIDTIQISSMIRAKKNLKKYWQKEAIVRLFFQHVAILGTVTI